MDRCVGKEEKVNILRNIIVLSIIALYIAGCVNVKSIPYETTARAPKSDIFPIELYESKDVQKPYKVIGIVQADAGKLHSVSDVLEKLRSAARMMGADALIDLSNQPIGGGVPSNRGTIYSGYVRDLWSAKAIIWELPNK
jgi:hypothetical protein